MGSTSGGGRIDSLFVVSRGDERVKSRWGGEGGNSSLKSSLRFIKRGGKGGRLSMMGRERRSIWISGESEVEKEGEEVSSKVEEMGGV